MVISKYLGIALIISAAAVSSAQDKVKIEPKWSKDSNYKLRMKSEFDISGHHATIEGLTSWSGEMGSDGYTVKVHHDQLTIVADDNEVNPPVNDYKIVFNTKGVFTSLEGGIDGADATRMFMVTHFYNPSIELTKDVVAKWDVAQNDKISVGALNVETTYLGESEIGKKKVLKIKQVVKEAGTSFKSEGVFLVTSSGQTLKADVKFEGMPIPAAGGDAAGKFTVILAE